MWAANLNQVFTKNPCGEKYECWVLFLRHGTGTAREKSIRSKHEDIDTILAEQNVNYTEITTRAGKRLVYDKFNFRNSKHPLFLILNKHPLNYVKGDSLMVVEWGKWREVDGMTEDLMALVNFFSDEGFRKNLVEAKNPKMWKKAIAFLEEHGITILKIGVTIAVAIA